MSSMLLDSLQSANARHLLLSKGSSTSHRPERGPKQKQCLLTPLVNLQHSASPSLLLRRVPASSTAVLALPACTSLSLSSRPQPRRRDRQRSVAGEKSGTAESSRSSSSGSNSNSSSSTGSSSSNAGAPLAAEGAELVAVDTGQALVPVASRQRLWYAAVKPKMYAVAVVPVLVAAAAAYAKCKVAFWGRFWLLFGGAVFNIAWLNLSNDVFDSSTGADVHKAESVVNLTGKRSLVLLLANVLLLVSGLFLGQAARLAKDQRVVMLLSTAVAMGYLYQGPPFRLSYKGLGEPLCFLAFGPFAVSAFYFAMMARRATGALPMLSSACFASSIAVGLTTTVVLFCSHFHQVVSDKAAGKYSPLVRMGSSRGVQVLSWAVLGLYIFVGLCLWSKALPLQCALVFPASFPAALALLTFGWEHYANPEKVRPLKLYALEWHTAVGLALAAGLAVSPLPTPPVLLAIFTELQNLFHT